MQGHSRQIDSTSEIDALDPIKVLKSEHTIAKLDVVIANAGISNYFGKATVTPAEEILSHFKINTVAPLLLFLATIPLLSNVPNPKLITITSGAGSISNMENLPVKNTAYGSLKAAANFVIRKIHLESEFNCFSCLP